MSKKNDIQTSDLRLQLKKVMEDEINELSTLLKNMEAKERVHFILKLAPYVFPRVDSVHHTEGEYEY